ncbi:MAG: hypothetical protein ACYTXC_14315 [Nostoc sp.]
MSTAKTLLLLDSGALGTSQKCFRDKSYQKMRLTHTIGVDMLLEMLKLGK